MVAEVTSQASGVVVGLRAAVAWGNSWQWELEQNRRCFVGAGLSDDVGEVGVQVEDSDREVVYEEASTRLHLPVAGGGAARATRQQLALRGSKPTCALQTMRSYRMRLHPPQPAVTTNTVAAAGQLRDALPLPEGRLQAQSSEETERPSPLQVRLPPPRPAVSSGARSMVGRRGRQLTTQQQWKQLPSQEDLRRGTRSSTLPAVHCGEATGFTTMLENRRKRFQGQVLCPDEWWDVGEEDATTMRGYVARRVGFFTATRVQGDTMAVATCGDLRSHVLEHPWGLAGQPRIRFAAGQLLYQ